jgi:hypothetical protein
MSAQPSELDQAIYWHPRYWSTISMKYRGEYLGFRQGKRLDGYWRRDDRHEWTDVGREDFAGAEAPEAINVEVTIIGARKWRSVVVYEYRQPQGETGPGHRTP